MSRWVAAPLLELQLWYGDVFVADLHQVFPHQGTWFGTYDLKIAPGGGPVPDRLIEYVAFCEDFDRRIAAGLAHDFAEFDRFGPVANTGSWRVPLPDGEALPMEGSIGFSDGQVSWRHPETEPSTEAAANEVWARVAGFVTVSERAERADGAEPLSWPTDLIENETPGSG